MFNLNQHLQQATATAGARDCVHRLRIISDVKRWRLKLGRRQCVDAAFKNAGNEIVADRVDMTEGSN